MSETLPTLMNLTLVARGLLAHDAARLAAQPQLARLAALARARAEADLDAALLRSLDIEAAIAPLAALGAGVDVAERWVVRVEPVTMIASHDDVRIEGRVDDLHAHDAQRVVARLAAHFAEDGLELVAPRADAWFALSRTAHTFETTPLTEAIGRPLRDRLPRGADSARWRRWLTESQMLLADDPLAQRQRPLTGVWFEGGGTLPVHSGIPALGIDAAAGRAGDVARGLAMLAGVEAGTIATLGDVVADASSIAHRVVALDVGPQPTALDAFAADFVAPALAALQRGHVRAVALCADRSDFAASWSAHRPSFVERWLSRNAAFAMPQGEAA